MESVYYTGTCDTFNESDGLLQPVGVFIAVIENVAAQCEAGRAIQHWIDLIDREEHRLQGLVIKIA